MRNQTHILLQTSKEDWYTQNLQIPDWSIFPHNVIVIRSELDRFIDVPKIKVVQTKLPKKFGLKGGTTCFAPSYPNQHSFGETGVPEISSKSCLRMTTQYRSLGSLLRNSLQNTAAFTDRTWYANCFFQNNLEDNPLCSGQDIRSSQQYQMETFLPSSHKHQHTPKPTSQHHVP